MNIKKIGAIAAGTALVGATLAGGAAASSHTYTDSDGTTIPEDFFVEDGELNTKIVVGSQAAPADVKAASDVGLAIGSKLYTEEEITPEIDTVNIKEDTTDDSYKIPVYSNVWDRNENKGTARSDLYSDNADREDLPGENYYDISADPSIGSGEDWGKDEDLDSGFNVSIDTGSGSVGNIWGDTAQFTFTMDEVVSTWDYDEEETFNLDASLDLTIGGSDDDYSLERNIVEDFGDSSDDYPASSMDLRVQPDALTVDFLQDDEDSTFGNPAPKYRALTADDEFTMMGKTYVVENVYNEVGNENDTLTVSMSQMTKWGKTGDTLDFNGYEITLLDVDTDSNKVLFEIENPDGDVQTDTLTENNEEDYWEEDVYVNATNVFAGIEGTNQAEFEVSLDRETLESDTSDWPANNWSVDTIVAEEGEDIDDDGTDETWVEKFNVTYDQSEAMTGSSVEVLDYFTAEYKTDSWTGDIVDDIGVVQTEDALAFESWIEFTPPETSETHELEMGDSFGDVYSVEGATAEDVMSKTLHPVTESMTMLDSEVDLENIDSNYILVGGPVANSVVEALVDAGVSEVNWEESEGSLEFVEYADYDHLIVAGQTRDETQDAAEDLMEQLAE